MIAGLVGKGGPALQYKTEEKIILQLPILCIESIQEGL
jgi:hypothetical protein